MSGYKWFNSAYDRNVIHRPPSSDDTFSKNFFTSMLKLGARATPYVREAVVGTAKLTGAAALGTAKYAVKNPVKTGAALYVAGKYTDKSNPQRVFNPFAAPYAKVDPAIPTSGTAYNSDNVILPPLGRNPETVLSLSMVSAAKSQQVSPAQALDLIVRSLLTTI